jgi:hypothetical protein
MNRDLHSDEELKEIYKLRDIAVVGMSRSAEKPGYFVAKYLIDHGYNVIPVNPAAAQILGRKAYPNVSSVPEGVEIIDVFRPSDDVPAVVRDALRKDGIKVIWMQQGIYSKEAERMAIGKGIKVVYNRCMMVEHARLLKSAN